MNIKSQHGLTLIVIALISITMLLYTASMAINLHSLKEGADTIGETVGDTIDNISAEDMAASWWVNQQKLMPNKHAVEMHGADAWRSTDCYNRNGTWRIYRIDMLEFHLLCRDDDGSLRDIILKRRTNTSKEFDMVNAFSPKKGAFKRALQWLIDKKAQQASVPNDIIIFIDDVAP